MPLCRYCDSKIDHLNQFECQFVVYETDADLEIVENSEDIRSTEIIHWECPLCEEVLFWRHDKARAFLRKKEVSVP